jgi:carbonic anhydrase
MMLTQNAGSHWHGPGSAGDQSPRPDVYRRSFLTGSAAILAGGAAGLFLSPARAQTTASPDAALARLMDGNARFVARRLTSFDDDLAILQQNTVAKQEPFAAILSCADSRVPVELVFDQTIGHVFVTRVAGNICTPEIIASLEYGAAVLGTAAIMVLGHAGCGAVQAAVSGKSVPGQISALYAPIRPAVERAGAELDAAIKANAQIQADLLRTASPVLTDLIAAGKLKVFAGFYELSDGHVSLLA